jgi:hypothetical protein
MAAKATGGGFLRSPLTVPVVLGWIAAWLVTRGLMVVQVGYWNDLGVNYQDVEFYAGWASTMVEYGELPSEESWQYPPGAAFLLLIPRIGSVFGAAYEPSFVALMLLGDLIGLAVLALLARRSGRTAGIWVWLLAIPLLQANPLTRFDLAPTVLTMAALVAVHRRTALFGALAGAGIALKVWPMVALFAEWDRRRLVRAVAAAAGVVALTFLVATIVFGDQSGFFANQDVRGLQKEAVANIPWYTEWGITGHEPEIVLRSGSAELGGEVAEAVAKGLKWLGLLALAAAAAYWWARERAIRGGRTDLADAAVSRDFVFTLVLLQIVVSRVLSPQFMIWVIGLAAIVLGAERTNLARPAWIALGAVALTTGIYIAPFNMVARNVALIVAAVDATLIMVRLLRAPRQEPAQAPAAEPVAGVARAPG